MNKNLLRAVAALALLASAGSASAVHIGVAGTLDDVLAAESLNPTSAADEDAWTAAKCRSGYRSGRPWSGRRKLQEHTEPEQIGTGSVAGQDREQFVVVCIPVLVANLHDSTLDCWPRRGRGDVQETASANSRDLWCIGRRILPRPRIPGQRQ